ncbi:MAG: GerMN domain-containing protein [Lapillicoccus sp.]
MVTARRVAVAAALSAALGLTAACGLPRSSTPVLVPAAEVPYGLLDGPSPSPTPSASPGATLTPGSIYLVDTQQKLVAVDVQVPQGPLVPLLQTLLTRLAVGPTDRERSRGLVTDLGPGSTIVLRSVVNGVANIELQNPNQDPSPAKLPVAIGQIVLTASSVVGVDRVVFVKDGTAVSVQGPTGGNLTPDPLVAGSYVELLAPGQATPPRTVPSATPAPTTSSTTTAAP